MFRFMLSDCQQALNGVLTGDDVELSSFSIDTRTLKAGDLYIAIKGDNFDGHDYCQQAIDKGAVGLLVHKPVEVSVPVMQVEDTRSALINLSRLWADIFQVPTVAVTGSNGKTTVKELIAAILGQLGPVLATKGNLNNDIGVPLTLLSIRAHHRYAVVEMGANHKGEIAQLSQLVQPDVALVNNIGPAHLEGFGSIDAVAQAKSEIYSGVSSDGWAVINADDTYAEQLREAASHCRTTDFGFTKDAAVQLQSGSALQIKCVGKTLAPRFALLGQHNRLNAAAAIAAARCLDVQPVAIMAGIASVLPVNGRLDSKSGYAGARLIDDTYNANPASVKAAITVLKEQGGTTHLVLGDMAELGPDEQELHAQVGTFAKQAGIDQLWTVGKLSQHASQSFGSSNHFDTQAALVEAIKPVLSSEVCVLVKGSRGSQMEHVVEQLAGSEPLKRESAVVEEADTTEVISL